MCMVTPSIMAGALLCPDSNLLLASSGTGGLNGPLERQEPRADKGTHHPYSKPAWAHPIGPDAELKTLCQEGQLDAALDALSLAIHQVSFSSLEIACHSLLNTCEKRRSLHQAKQVHAHLAAHGLDSTSSLGEHLVSTFVKCGSLQHALHVFHMLPHRTAFSWTALISAHVDSAKGHIALEIYKLMQEEGVEPNKFTFVSLLKACGSISNLECGKALHADARRKGLDSDLFIGSALVNMYGKCGDVLGAEDVFDGLCQRDIVSWSAMLSAYLEQHQGEKALLLYRQMHEEGLRPDQRLILIALQACCILAEKEEAVLVQGHPTKVKSLEIGKALHSGAWKMGLDSDLFVGSTLVSMYGKCGDITGAKNVFDGLSQRDVILWTVMLSAYIDQGKGEKTLRLFKQMQEEGVSPDDQTFVMSLQACSILADMEEVVEGKFTKPATLKVGQALHADAQRMGFDTDVFVGSTLVTMYGKCGNIEEAEKVFGELPFRDIILWNAMLSAYVEQGEGEKALHLYKQMQEEGMGSDECTLVIALQACCTFAEKEDTFVVGEQSTKVVSLKIGQALHLDAQRKGIDSCLFVGSTLVSMYNKCGSVVEAEKVFSGFSECSVVLWNAILTAFVQHGQGEKALQLYQHMLEKHVTMDDTTLICILQACSETGSVEICKQIHFIVVSSLSSLSLPMATTLIHAYGSCASMADAQAVFRKVPQHDLVVWNALISGHARDGNCAASFGSFDEMLWAGIKPNGLSFLPLLSICSHAGLVDRGVAYFESMSRDYGITPKIEHYASMLDLLVRAGDLTKVLDMLSRMPLEPDLAMWVCLLSACQKHGNVDLAKQAFDHAVHLQPKEAASYILMSNIYADAGLQECAIEVDNARCREGAWEDHDLSWIVQKQDLGSYLITGYKHLQQEWPL